MKSIFKVYEYKRSAFSSEQLINMGMRNPPTLQQFLNGLNVDNKSNFQITQNGDNFTVIIRE